MRSRLTLPRALALALAIAIPGCGSKTITRTVVQTRTVAPPNHTPVWRAGGPQRILSKQDRRLLAQAGGDGFIYDDLDAFRKKWAEGDPAFARCLLRRMKVPRNDSRIVYLLIALEQQDDSVQEPFASALGWCIGEKAVRDHPEAH